MANEFIGAGWAFPLRTDAVGNVALTFAGLPPGVAPPPPITVNNGATDFKFALKFPPNFKPGEYPGLKISATGKPFGPVQVRGRDAEVTLKVLAPDPPAPPAPPNPKLETSPSAKP